MIKKCDENEHFYDIDEYHKGQINVALFSNVQACNFVTGAEG